MGLAKHAGKTECFNYILRRVRGSGRRFAVTSIGVDGESYDITSTLAKPEIEVYEGMIFVTSEAHYRQKRLVAEILDISGRRTALGRLVTARALTDGKALLSGPADTGSLAALTERLYGLGAQTVLIDGALSRLSPASPAIAEAMVLATGAAVSTDPEKLVRATAYVCRLIGLPFAPDPLRERLRGLENGIYAVGEDGEVCDLGVQSALSADAAAIPADAGTLYVAGAVNDGLLKILSKGGEGGRRRVVARDFTRIVASADVFGRFVRGGGTVEVLDRSRLLAVCVNPLAPDGMLMDSSMLQEWLRAELDVPVCDVRRM